MCAAPSIFPFFQMTSEYRLDFYDPDGTRRAQSVAYLSLVYTRTVNDSGLCEFVLGKDSQAAASILQHRSIVEVWRRNTTMGIDWYRDFVGLQLDPQSAYTGDPPHDLNTYRCPGVMWLLASRIVNYKSGTSNRSLFANDPVETVMKTLVEYNTGASATVANSRLREGTIPGITTQADGAGGSVIDWRCAYDNLLETLKLLGNFGGDYDLERVGESGTSYVFNFYPGQRGTDRTATVIFNLGYGNMAEPLYRLNRRGEKTAATVGGQGEGAARVIEIVLGSDYAADNDIEYFADARNLTTVGELQDKGAAVLAELARRPEFSFRTLQTPGTFYGKHYFFGDLVSYRYTGLAGTVSGTGKVNTVTISVNENGSDTVSIELKDT